MLLSSTVMAGCVLVWAVRLFMALRATSITAPPHAGNEAILSVAITCTIGINAHGVTKRFATETDIAERSFKK